jgi:hypothetical protein
MPSMPALLEETDFALWRKRYGCQELVKTLSISVELWHDCGGGSCFVTPQAGSTLAAALQPARSFIFAVFGQRRLTLMDFETR